MATQMFSASANPTTKTATTVADDLVTIGNIPSDILLKASEYVSQDSPNPVLHTVNVACKSGHIEISFTDGEWGNRFYDASLHQGISDISVNVLAEAIKNIYTEETIYIGVKTNRQHIILTGYLAKSDKPNMVETGAVSGEFPNVFAALPKHRKSRESMGPIPMEYRNDVRTATKIPFEAFHPSFPRRVLKDSSIGETTRVDNSNRPVWFTSVCGTWSFDRLLLPPMMQALINSR